MATDAPITGAPTRAPFSHEQLSRVQPNFVLANRALIENEIEWLIALLDTVDGDPDLEDDDPAGDTLDEHGEAPTENGCDLLLAHPRYGIDQSLGPINEREAMRERHQQMMGM